MIQSAMEIGLFIIGFLSLIFTPLSIGSYLVKNNENLSAYYIKGWLLLSLYTGLFLVIGIANQLSLQISYIFISILLLPRSFNLFQLIISKIKRIKEFSRLEKILLSLCIILLCLRLFRCLLPNLNWDTLNNHFLLLSERLKVGSLEAIPWIPTDRRVPLGGSLYKLIPLTFNESGRLIIFNNFIFYFVSILSIGQILKKLYDYKAMLLGCSIFLSIPNLFVHINNAGDEAMMSLIIIYIISTTVFNNSFSKRDLVFSSLSLTLLLSIKLTALFWVPFLFLFLIYKGKTYKKTLLSSLFIFCIFVLLIYYREYSNYQMVYPFTRWSDLLLEPPESRVFDSNSITHERYQLGLEDDFNNKKIHNNIFDKFIQNLKTFFTLPLGPFIPWLFILFWPYKIFKCSSSKIIVTILFIIVFSLSMSFCAWQFTAPALYRYHLPTWFLLLLTLNILLYERLNHWKLIKVAFSITLVIILFCSVLETKVGILPYKKSFFFQSEVFWKRHASEGKFIEFIHREYSKEPQNFFYIGNACFLLKGNSNWYAQIGNEVGWRSTEHIGIFIKEKNIKFWARSFNSDKIDPIYSKLTQYLLEQKIILFDKTSPYGNVYKINSLN